VPSFPIEIPHRELKPGVQFKAGGEILVYCNENLTEIRATRNRCRHNGGKFNPREGCVAKCSSHGWELDCRTMTYVNPQGGLPQPELEVELTASGITIREGTSETRVPVKGEKQPLEPGQLRLRFLAHACMEIRCGKKKIFTDPWLVGPAFARGWWLIHHVPEGWAEDVASADLVYISHNHSDHLSPHSLKEIVKINPDLRIVVPGFESTFCQDTLKRLGFTRIEVAKFCEPIDLDDHLRISVLPDASGRDDSGLFLEYKGHTLLNTVDSKNLCGGALPHADVLLTSFAGAASGYPVCWEDMYSSSKIRDLAKGRRISSLHQVRKVAEIVKPKAIVPFAGYFVEAHPADVEMRERNVKNSPQGVRDYLRKEGFRGEIWLPVPNATFDVATLSVDESAVDPKRIYETDYQFEKYTGEIAAVAARSSFDDLRNVQRYFDWAGFRGDLVLELVETDEDLKTVRRDYYVDFRNGKVTEARPAGAARFERMRVRQDVLWFVMHERQSWEEISIGFQARFYREPDVYNFDFWSHFQNDLPGAVLRLDE